MRTIYNEQLRRHLEPESISIQSKNRSVATNSTSQQSASNHAAIGTKIKQDLFRNHRPQESFTSFDLTALT